MTMPMAPKLPTPNPPVSVPSWYSAADMVTYTDAWVKHSTALLAEIERLKKAASPAPTPTPTPALPRIEFSFDIGNLPGTPDTTTSDADKLRVKKAALGVSKVTDVRVFFGTSVPRWDNARIRALDPAKGDTFLLSTLTTDWAGLLAFFKATPDAWKGKYKVCYGHEREANLMTDALLRAWLDGNKRTTDLMVSANVGLTPDHFGKLGLYYSQQEDQRPEVPTREEMYGGQDWGFFGEDCYQPRARLARGFYTSPQLLFGPILDFCEQIKRPCLIGEWGGERASGDTTGAGRAQAITEGGAYLKSRHGKNGLRIIGANWWWAYGIRDGVVLDHNLANGSPELDAFRKLAQG